MANEKQVINLAKLAIRTERPKNISETQAYILEELVKFIYAEISDKINYDHVNLEIPRTPLRLWYRKRRRDISFLLGRELVFIDVYVEKL